MESKRGECVDGFPGADGVFFGRGETGVWWGGGEERRKGGEGKEIVVCQAGHGVVLAMGMAGTS